MGDVTLSGSAPRTATRYAFAESALAKLAEQIAAVEASSVVEIENFLLAVDDQQHLLAVNFVVGAHCLFHHRDVDLGAVDKFQLRHHNAIAHAAAFGQVSPAKAVTAARREQACQDRKSDLLDLHFTLPSTQIQFTPREHRSATRLMVSSSYCHTFKFACPTCRDTRAARLDAVSADRARVRPDNRSESRRRCTTDRELPTACALQARIRIAGSSARSRVLRRDMRAAGSRPRYRPIRRRPLK